MARNEIKENQKVYVKLSHYKNNIYFQKTTK